MCGLTAPGTHHTNLLDKHQALSSFFPGLSQSAVCNPAYLESSFRCSRQGGFQLINSGLGSFSNSEKKQCPRFESDGGSQSGVPVELCCSSTVTESSIRDHSIDTLLNRSISQAVAKGPNSNHNNNNNSSNNLNCSNNNISACSSNGNVSNKTNNSKSNIANNEVRIISSNIHNNNVNSSGVNHSIRNIVGVERERGSSRTADGVTHGSNGNSEKTPSPDSSYSPWSSPHPSSQERERGKMVQPVSCLKASK